MRENIITDEVLTNFYAKGWVVTAQALGPSIRGIAGDPLYNRQSTDTSRMMLHAYKLEFRHPRTQQQQSVIAFPPSEFLQNIEQLELLRRYRK